MKNKYLIEVALMTIFNINIVRAQPFFTVGGGTNNGIDCLFSDSLNGVLYVGGQFTQAGNISSNSIARWNGIDWDSLNNNLAGAAKCINMFNSDLYIGGGFSSYDTFIGQWQILSGLIKWNSINYWWAVPDSNLNGNVEGILNYNGSMYIMGNFDTVGNMHSSKIARYDGGIWHSFPTLDNNGGGWAITDGIFFNGNLYVGGNFNSQIAPSMKDIAKWDGLQWLPVDNGLSGQFTWVNDFAIYQGKLIVAGYFNMTNGDPGNGIAAWDGNQWSQLGTGLLNGQVFSLEVYNNELWAGGSFNNAGGIPVTYLAKWDGLQWSSLNVSLDNIVSSMAVLDNDLYIAGSFWEFLNGDTAKCIMRYNSATGFESLNSRFSKIKMGPNPTQGYFSIYSPIYNIEKIQFINLSGEVIFTKDQILSNAFECKLNFPDGIYITEVVVNKNIYRNKLLIVH